MKNFIKNILLVVIPLLFISSAVYGITKIGTFQGGTNQDSSAWTGYVYVNSGVWGTSTPSGGSSLFSTSTSFTYLTDTTSDLVIGNNATTSAPFWMDISTGDLTITGNLLSADSFIELTDLSSTATGLTYTSATGVFSLTANYEIPTTASTTDWTTAYGWGDWSGQGFIDNTVATLSSLTSIGTIGTGVWQGTPILNAYIASSTEFLIDTDTTYTGGDFLTLTGTDFDVDATTTISNGDTTHLTTGDAVYDFVIGLGYGTGDVLSVGNCAGGACFDGTSDGGTYLDFYDAQGVGRLITGNIEAGVTWTLPTATSTLVGDATACTDIEGTGLSITDGVLNWSSSGLTWAGDAITDAYVDDTITIASSTLAVTLTITDNEDTAENNAVLFTSGGDLDGGNLGIESDGTFYYTPSTGKVTATGFVGSLTGQADTVGTIAGLAPDTATTQATQPNITSIANLATIGTITTGVWNGTAVGTQWGGTGQNWSAVATGSVAYFSDTGVLNTLAKGDDGQVLTLASGIPAWTAAGAGDVLSVGDCTEGACLDGTSDGGTNILFYDAQGATQLIGGDTAGAIVLTLPITTGTILNNTDLNTMAELDTLIADANVLSEEEIDASSELLALMDDETGTGVLVFGTEPTFTTSITVPLILTGDTTLTLGDATTDSITFVSDGTGNAEFTFPADVIGDADIDWGSEAGQVGYADLGSIVVSDTSITAGRSLTWSTNDMVADPELYTSMICFSVQNATTTQNPAAQHKFATAVTISRITCGINNATSSIQFDERAEGSQYVAGTDVLSAALTCATTTASSTDFANATIAADSVISLDIDACSGNATTSMSICVDFTRDD